MVRQWKEGESCKECGTIEKPHHAHGLCTNCYGRYIRRKNPEVYRENDRRWRIKPENKQKRKDYAQSEVGKQKTIEKARRYREKNREICLERTRLWRDKNRDKIKEYNDSKRDLKVVKLYGEDALRKLMEEDYKCEKCGSDKKPCIHHIDWDDTNNVYENFAILCSSCHSKLHSWQPPELRKQIFEEWMKDNLI